MKVSELIFRLSQLPLDALVLVDEGTWKRLAEKATLGRFKRFGSEPEYGEFIPEGELVASEKGLPVAVYVTG